MIEKYEYIQGLEVNPTAKRMMIWILIHQNDNKIRFNWSDLEGVTIRSANHYYSDAIKQLIKSNLIIYRFNGREILVDIIDERLREQ